jgi:outer membrane protein assembly factor BamB
VPADLTSAEWPGFRGADRAARSHGPLISSDWTTHPPRQLWKIAVGPAWSSFAVAGKFLFTQEQRGPMETVVCYEADTGREVWNRPIEGRLDDPLGGPGPRATPALADGGLFATCATGLFLRLNPSTGEIVWQQDLKTVAGRTVPMWGFSASPIVAEKVVIVHAGGPGDKGLLAFDVESGALRWSVAAGNDSYSSPQLSTIAGETMVLMLSNDGLVLVDPATGKSRLNYEWKFSNYRALQPAVVGTDTILLPTGMSTGTRAIRVTNSNGQLAATELWTSKHLKPDFTDLVTYQGFAYGNDAGIFTCVDLNTGDRQWKGGRYGKGQVLLLEDSGVLLIAAEDGQVVLLRADPKQHAEIATFKALEGKTWNHPVVVGDRLYVRNSQEAACFQLSLAESKTAAE